MAVDGLHAQVEAQLNQNRADLERKQAETQRIVQKIAASLEDLTRLLNSYKPTSEGELGKLRGEITSKVTNRFSVTEQPVTQLFGKLETQTKSAADNSELLHDLIVGIGNLWYNVKKIKKKWIIGGTQRS